MGLRVVKRSDWVMILFCIHFFVINSDMWSLKDFFWCIKSQSSHSLILWTEFFYKQIEHALQISTAVAFCCSLLDSHWLTESGGGFVTMTLLISLVSVLVFFLFNSCCDNTGLHKMQIAVSISLSWAEVPILFNLFTTLLPIKISWSYNKPINCEWTEVLLEPSKSPASWENVH